MLDFFRTVKAKMGLGFGVILILVIILGVTSVVALKQSSAAEDRMFSKNVLGLRYLTAVNTLLGQTQSKALRLLKNRDDDAVRDLASFFEQANPKIETNFGQYYPGKIRAESEKLEARQAIDNYHEFASMMERFISAAQSGNYEQANTLYLSRIASPFETLRNNLHDLADAQVSQAEAAHAAALTSAHRKELFVMVLLGIVLLLTFATTIWLARMITIPLARARSVVGAISEGRLDNEIDNPFKDEFGAMLAALSNMQSRLTDVVRQVRDSSESVGVGAGQIASGNDELSTRTQEQAASLEQTAASMEQMTSTVKQNADNAAQADQLSQDVRRQARLGGEVVGRAVTAMDEISASSRKISDIVGLIDDIAFQTNLLALNASVEAARAGEQGRGFAVVATEVRNLASRSAAAAKDIKELVEDSTAKVADGSQEVARSGTTLEEIVESVTKVSDLVSEMASASKEQAEGITQVNTAVSQMDSMTQENASLVEESAAASRSLEEQARALKTQVAFFRIAAGEAVMQSSVPAAATAPKQSHGATTTTKPTAPQRKTPAREEAVPEESDDDDNWTSF
ncbi:methyl-accepting chemotaxis protein [Salinisphaera sp. Q1T1-3]|uniref:methyl-accepting chemotaxis protein n=1 Tax=Salinisphaera sp. Q1T1-3 TaxID=2321229 RepID=UPI000E73C033|nr:methyl-accepting chemotaxis protein [Salinisphaera sp. Q1T1-3]RJS95165.1 HAMP domain-containing protein [Salinisphaera sp. Q1T1-3]